MVQRLTRASARHETSSLARLDGEKMDRFVTRAREGGRSQTGDAPPVVSAASFRSVSAPKGLPLRETVRPHSEITGNGLTPRPSDYAPDAPPVGREVSIDGRALPRRARTNPGHAS